MTVFWNQIFAQTSIEVKKEQSLTFKSDFMSLFQLKKKLLFEGQKGQNSNVAYQQKKKIITSVRLSMYQVIGEQGEVTHLSIPDYKEMGRQDCSQQVSLG